MRISKCATSCCILDKNEQDQIWSEFQTSRMLCFLSNLFLTQINCEKMTSRVCVCERDTFYKLFTKELLCLSCCCCILLKMKNCFRSDRELTLWRANSSQHGGWKILRNKKEKERMTQVERKTEIRTQRDINIERLCMELFKDKGESLPCPFNKKIGCFKSLSF